MRKLSYLIIFIQVFASCERKPNAQIIYKPETNDVLFFENEQIINLSARNLFREGLENVKLEEFEKAKQKFIEANTIENNNPVILNGIAQAENRLGNMQKSNEISLKALSIDSSYAPTYINLGNNYIQTKNYEKAKTILLKGGKYISEKNLHVKSVYLSNLALVYKNLRDCPRALIYINQALEISQDKKFTDFALKLKARIEYCLE